MGLKNCQIQLDNPWNTYYAGQTINGQVTLTFDSPKKVRGILIQFLGKATTLWGQKENPNNRNSIERNFSGNEIYFDKIEYLFGKENCSDDEMQFISAGTVNYPFKYTLSTTLPSSYEDKYGYIRYTAAVIVNCRPQYNEDFIMPFTVISPVDLNLIPNVTKPGYVNITKKFGGIFCYKSDNLLISVSIPVTGYVPGQNIPISCFYKNSSDKIIDKIKFKLQKTIIYYVTQPTQYKKQEEFLITEICGSPFPQRFTTKWNCSLNIPPLPSSNMINCSIIDLNYYLYVEIEGVQIGKTLKGKIPITLGTIPLDSFTLCQSNSQQMNSLNDANVISEQPPISSISNIPLVFAESHIRATSFGDGSAHSHLLNENGFAPRYPTYSFSPNNTDNTFRNALPPMEGTTEVDSFIPLSDKDQYNPISVTKTDHYTYTYDPNVVEGVCDCLICFCDCLNILFNCKSICDDCHTHPHHSNNNSNDSGCCNCSGDDTGCCGDDETAGCCDGCCNSTGDTGCCCDGCDDNTFCDPDCCNGCDCDCNCDL